MECQLKDVISVIELSLNKSKLHLYAFLSIPSGNYVSLANGNGNWSHNSTNAHAIEKCHVHHWSVFFIIHRSILRYHYTYFSSWWCRCVSEVPNLMFGELSRYHIDNISPPPKIRSTRSWYPTSSLMNIYISKYQSGGLVCEHFTLWNTHLFKTDDAFCFGGYRCSVTSNALREISLILGAQQLLIHYFVCNY